MTPSAVLIGRSLDVPVDPDAEQARQWAVDELSKQPYQAAKPGLLQQIWQSIVDFFNNLVSGLQNFTGADSGVIGTVLVLVVISLIAALIFLLRPRLLHRQKTAAEIFEAEQFLSAAEHRQRAMTSAAAGDYDGAVAELFRALVRAAEERVILDPQPGRTADEVVGSLTAAFGSEAVRLRQAATLFNRVRYAVHQPGTAKASAPDYQWLQTLDESLRQLHPVHDDARLDWVAPQ